MEESPGWYVRSRMHLNALSKLPHLEAWAGIEGGWGKVKGDFGGFQCCTILVEDVQRMQFSCLPAGSREAPPHLRLCLRLSAWLALESPLFSNDFPPPRPQLSHAKRRQLRRPAASPDTMLSAGGAAASLALLMLLPLLCCCHLCHSLRKFCGFYYCSHDCFFLIYLE